MKRTRLSIFLLGLGLQGFAQQAPAFTWQAALPLADSTGYYHIVLGPAVSALAYRQSGWDLRLFDGAKEVPYLTSETLLSDVLPSFVSTTLPFTRESASSIIVENPGKRKLDKLTLVYKNSRVRKTIQVSGSYNRKDWYGITERINFDPSAGDVQRTDHTASSQSLSLPASDYAYYRLHIDDSLKAPLFIERVMVTSSAAGTAPAYTVVAGTRFQAVSSREPKESAFLIAGQSPFLADRLRLDFAGPGLFHREASLMLGYPGQVLLSFTLSSDQPGYFEIPRALYDSLYLVIRNGDSPPLQLQQAEVSQKTEYLVAWLENGRNYELRGGASLPPPQYDLAHFSTRVNNEDAPQIAPGPPENIAQTKPPAATPSFFESSGWIWAGILLVVAVLGLVVRRMVRDIRDRNTP